MGFLKKNKKIDGWLTFSFQKDGISVTHIRRQSSTKPVVELAAFYSATKTSLAETLGKIAKDLHAERYDCAALLGTGEYQLISIDAPNVPPDELKTAIRWRLKDMLDFHIDDATIDVLDVPVDKSAAVRNHSMYAVAARNQLIEQRQSFFGNAKIPLSVIDIPEMAQRNISALLEPEGRGVALLSFDADGGLLTVTYSGELYLSRRIEITLPQIVDAEEQYRTELYDRITLELQRSLDHFERQYQFITMSKVMLFPGDEKFSGLKEYLAANLYIPVEELNLGDVLDLSKVPEIQSPELQQRYFMTLGAALRYEEKAL